MVVVVIQTLPSDTKKQIVLFFLSLKNSFLYRNLKAQNHKEKRSGLKYFDKNRIVRKLRPIKTN